MKYAPVLLGILLLAAGCGNKPPVLQQTERVNGIPGPEDIVLDAGISHGEPRLIISATDRRSRPLFSGSGDLFWLEPQTLNTGVFTRYGEPFTRKIQPHGIDLYINGGGERILYVINHYCPQEDGSVLSSILVYRIEGNGLYYLDELTDPLLVSPNDLAVASDGTLYVGNDSKGNPWADRFLSLSRSAIVMKKPDEPWQIVADGLGAVCGIGIVNGYLLASANVTNEIVRFNIEEDGSLSGRAVIARIPGPDNIVPAEGNRFTVTSHESNLRIMRHAFNENKSSPGSVYIFDAETGEFSSVFSDDGSTISACSVAVPFEDDLFLGQIFDSFVLKVSEVY